MNCNAKVGTNSTKKKPIQATLSEILASAKGIPLPEEIKLSDGYVGIDLSSKIDLTSVYFIFPLPDEIYVVISHSFMPEGKYEPGFIDKD